MQIEFIENSKRDYWNDFILKNNGSFIQSFEWGEFQESLSKKIWRIIVRDDENVLLAAQVIKERMKFKNYLYIPYGPIFSSDLALEMLLKRMEELAKEEDCIFLRIEPVSDLPKNIKLKSTSKRLQPKRTLLVDLTKDEKDIINSFEKRTRYNIRLAEKKGVLVDVLDNYPKDFYGLLSKTKERQEFNSYSESYYEKLSNLNNKGLQTKVFLAKYEGNPVVATLAVFFGNTVTTLHTGFDYNFRSLKAPYLVRWKVILEGKKLGKTKCDFWGIDEKKWPGVTHLKRSFNGNEIEYGDGKDFVFNNVWYFLYRILIKVL